MPLMGRRNSYRPGVADRRIRVGQMQQEAPH